MLIRSKKEVIVNDLKANIDKSHAVFLTNLIGVGSNDANNIRKAIREADGNVFITKNTLFEKAADGTKAESLFKSLRGTNAVAFAFSDAAAVAKCLYDAGKELKAVELKGGMLEDKQLTPEELKQLATLPSRDQMLATLLATFNAPISAFARVLNAIKDEKENGVEKKEDEAVSPAEELKTEE
ncbi:MAG: 50S ribosomal protein L10 [Bacteriovoracaceae bacterium]|nr:50S ribosomal protein L10 [Bacteriovoracaceae bacterium]